MNLSIFNFSEENSKRIYVNNINVYMVDIFDSLGGIKIVSELLDYKYSKVKEWKMGRRPISVSDLNCVLNLVNQPMQIFLLTCIDNSKLILSSRYSKNKLWFPNLLSDDLAYLLGIILGDGSLAGNNSNSIGNWNLSIFFDSKKHQEICDNIFIKVFSVDSKHHYPDKKLFVSYFCSRILHTFFTDIFEISNGLKCYIIKFPSKIIMSNSKIKANFLSGLFDSDGTFTCKSVKYSTTSRIMDYQVQECLLELGIKSYIYTWQKKGGTFRLLYTVSITSRKNIIQFKRLISFRHPNKKLRLLNFINSPVV